MNIWTGLLFLEGAVADASLARELAGVDASTSTQAPDTDAAESHASHPFPGRPDRGH